MVTQKYFALAQSAPVRRPLFLWWLYGFGAREEKILRDWWVFGERSEEKMHVLLSLEEGAER
jgi:hypothetical protein